MTINWGAYEVSSGTGMRSGIQIESQSTPVNASTTFVVTFTCWVQPGPNSPGTEGSAFNDNETFDLTVNAGSLNDASIAWLNTSHSLTAQQAGPQTITLTYTYGGTSYGVSPGTITISGTVNGVFNGITPNCSVVVTIPARPWANPAATTASAASRVSDTQGSVSWTNHDATSAAYGNIKLYRKTDAGSYALITTLAASAASYSDLGIVANHKYRWRPNVLGANGTEVTGAETGDIWTTPGAPTGCTATKQANGDVLVTWTNNVNYTEYLVEVQESTNGGSSWADLSTSVASGSTSYTHVTPSTATSHTYRVRAKTSSGTTLFSAYSAQSNTVTLLATANAPTNLTPSGVAQDAAGAIVFTWQHNPADGTPQSKYQLQYKIDAGSYTTVGPTTSAVSSYTLPAATLTNGHTITWHVATAGQNGTLSAYSADASFTTSAKPTVNISTPGATYNSSSLAAAWTYFQAQSSAQATWIAQLYDAASNLLETITGTTESAGTFTTALHDGASYTLNVAVTSAAGLTSDVDVQAFTVTFLPPAAVTITPLYDRNSGAMVLTIAGADPTVGVTVAIATVTIQRKVNDEDWVTIIAGLVLSGTPLSAVVIDTRPTINGTNTYRALAYSALPSSATSLDAVAITAEGYWSFLSAGDGFATIVRMKARPQFGAETSRERALHHFAGRAKPVQFEGEATTLMLSIAGELLADSSRPEEFEALALISGPVLWREPTGRRVFASLSKVKTSRSSHFYAAVAFDLTQIDYTE